MTYSLTAVVVKKGSDLEVLSPSIGKIELSVSLGQKVHQGEIIGHFHRLNKRMDLRLGEGKGTIRGIKSNHRLIPVEYAEVFLTIDEIADRISTTKKASSQLLKNPADFIEAPMDGMFYISASPETPPFVAVGDTITPGQTIGLIEVMKCFYPLKYQGKKSVVIESIAIKNATPIMSGTRLFAIK